MLRALGNEYPTLTQVAGGIFFSDPAKGRALIVDQTRVEVSENQPNLSPASVNRLTGDLQKAIPLLAFPPPYRVRVEGMGTIQAMEGLNPVEVLKAHAPPNAVWNEIAGPCAFACVRYLFTTEDGGQRDVHVEPLFAQPDKFYVMAVTMGGGEGWPSLDAAMNYAQYEVQLIERLSDRIVSDLAEPQPM